MSLFLVIKAFLLAVGISFCGSVQLGPVNFGTIHTALNKHKNAAIRFGFGGSLPELLYCALAFGSAGILEQFGLFQDYLKYLTSGILFVFGLVLIFQKSGDGKRSYQAKDGNEIWWGATFGLFNPQLYPFWLFIIAYLKSNDIHHFTSLSTQVAFTMGTAVGAFVLQYLVAVLASKNRAFIYTKITKNYNKVLGAVIIAVAIIQLVINS